MKEDALYLLHIRECITRIRDYTKKGKQEFFASTLIQDAVIRNLQTLAESTQRLSDDAKAGLTKVDWRKIAGFRNILVHNYLGLDLHKIWDIIEVDVPDLKNDLASLLTNLPKKEEKPSPGTKKQKRKRKS